MIRRTTAYITDLHRPPTHYVVCPVCGGRICFNLEEITARGGGSVYCAGFSTPTTGGQDPRNHWHPKNALVDAGPIRALSDDEGQEEEHGDQPQPRVE